MVNAEINPGLLVQIGSVQADGAERFAAAEHHEVANINRMWGNFREHFSDLVEENVRPENIAVCRLEEDHTFFQGEIDIRGTLKLMHLYCLIKRQAHGEEGPLLVNGSANTAEIRDDLGDLWTVSALYCQTCKCWDLEAFSADKPCLRRQGSQVLLINF